MFLSELGNRIRSQREKRSLKQQDVANALDITPQAVSKWERGENAPDVVTLGPLARLLGTSVDWLLGVKFTVAATSVIGEGTGEPVLLIWKAPSAGGAAVSATMPGTTEIRGMAIGGTN